MASPAHVKVQLRKPLRRTIRRGHPWIFRDALARLTCTPGDIITIVDERDRFIARGWAEEGPIAVRLLTTVNEPVDQDFLRRRIEAAATLRSRIVPPQTNTYRLLHGEGDRLPGVVCDVYGNYATLKLDGTATLVWRDAVVSALIPTLQSRGVEGLMLRTGRRGQKKVSQVWGQPCPQKVVVSEQGLQLSVDLVHGQKTGMFVDHRTARRVTRKISAGLRVLDLYSYIGGFSASAGLGGASSVVTVDISAGAIEAAGETWALNGLDPAHHSPVVADVPKFLAAQLEAGVQFDLIIADPPSFAPNRAAKPGALKAYGKLHQACCRLLAPRGYLLAASCSSHVTRDDFEMCLIEASDKVRRNLQVLDRWGAPPDHPRLLGFPEGDYLKSVLMRAVG